MSMRIAGSLWSVPSERVRAEALRLTSAGLTLWHWDRSDGTLGTTGGFSAFAARAIADETGLRSEAHLMLADPRPELHDWTAFAELVVVHVESDHWRECIDRIRDSGVRAGVAIAPSSPVPDDLPPDVAALIMTVTPGSAGSSFLDDRVDALGEVSDQPLRGVDGSVNLERSRAARERGGNWIVSGTALTSAPNARVWLESVEVGE